MVDLEKIASNITLGGAKALCKIGLEDPRLKEFENSSLLESLIGSVIEKYFEATSYEQVRNILGDDFITPEEIMDKRNDISYTENQLCLFRMKMPPLDIIRKCKEEKYLLVAGPSVKINFKNFYKNFSNHFNKRNLRDKDWFLKQEFSLSEFVEPGWYMIKKKTLSFSEDYSFKETIGFLSRNMCFPSAIQILWVLVINCIVRGSCMFDGNYVVANSYTYNPCYVKEYIALKCSNEDGISFCNWYDLNTNNYDFPPMLKNDKYIL